LTVKTSCEFVYSPSTCTSPSPTQQATLLDLGAGRVLEFTTTVDLPAATSDDPDRKTGLNFNVKFEGITTASLGKIADLGTVKPVVRCDGSTRGGFTSPACIFGGVEPQYSLSTTDPEVGAVAAHIYKAINDPNSTLPPYTGGNKIIPSLVSRTTDQLLQEAQRRRARYQCDKWIVPPPPDAACDEYPFAATYQGTFNEPENNYSVAFVDALQNSTEGGKRSAWVKADRILEQDYYRVVPYIG
jgi:hypothetical protein